MTAHAYALIDAYVYGFALSEASLPINGPETIPEVADQMMASFTAEDYPHLRGVLARTRHEARL